MRIAHAKCLTAMIALGLLAGCTDPGGGKEVQDEPTAPVQPSFSLVRQQDSSDRMELQALGGGVLTLKDGCLRIEHSGGSRLLLWPPNVTPTPEGDGVVDPTTGTGVRIGEWIVIGGGEIDGVRADGLADPIPATCAGPYWLGANGFFPAPKEEWQTVRIAETYSIQVRQEMAAGNPAPAALPARFSAGGLSVDVSHGVDVCEAAAPGAQGDQWIYYGYTDQRRAEFLRQRTSASETLDALFRGVDGPRGVTPPRGEKCLRVHAECATARDCDEARAMVSTIRFGDLGQPG